MDIATYKRRRRRALADSTLRQHVSVLQQLDEHIGGGEPSIEDLHTWLDKKDADGCSPSTLRQYGHAVRAYFDLVLHQDPPDLSRRFGKGSRTRREALSRDDVLAIFHAEPLPKYKALWRVLYEYARRIGEVLAQEGRDISLEAGRIRFNLNKGGGTERVRFDLSPGVADAVRAYYDTRGTPGAHRPVWIGSNPRQPITGTSVRRHLKKTSARAIDRHVVPHQFRHSRVTHLRAEGVPYKAIQEGLTKHQSLSTLQDTYAHATEAEVDAIPTGAETLGGS